MNRMRTSMLLAVLLGVVSCATVPSGGSSYASAPPPPGEAVDIGFFYDALAPYGIWITVAPYGLCWVPEDVAPGWVPYSDGTWEYTDYGWTWVDDEEWGWAPFHYGRWTYVADYGWAWVPDSVWGPAWVAWRQGEDCLGWAPLPPDATWEPGPGFEPHWRDLDTKMEPRFWCFVSYNDFGRPHENRYLVPERQRDVYLRRSRDVTAYIDVSNRVVNKSVDVSQVELKTGRRVARYRVMDADVSGGNRRVEVRGTVIRMPRPEVRPAGSAGLVPSRSSVPLELMQRHADEYRRLRQKQDQERAQLEKRYQSPPGSSPAARQAEMEKQHEAEIRSMEARQTRERQDLWKHQLRERSSPARTRSQAAR